MPFGGTLVVVDEFESCMLHMARGMATRNPGRITAVGAKGNVWAIGYQCRWADVSPLRYFYLQLGRGGVDLVRMSGMGRSCCSEVKVQAQVTMSPLPWNPPRSEVEGHLLTGYLSHGAGLPTGLCNGIRLRTSLVISCFHSGSCALDL